MATDPEYRVFRGSIAPASLKGHRSRAPLKPVGSFPGLYCPGLIEGTLTLTGPSDSRVSFPGLYCPGLIEGVMAITVEDIRIKVFRGSIAPASLKGDAAGG